MSYKEKKMKKHKMGVKVLLGYSILAIILIVCTCLAVGSLYWRDKMNEYSERAFAYTSAAAQYIDGDKAVSYLETGEKDEYYQMVQELLDINRAETDMKYFYVFVPTEEDIVYIWDAENGEMAASLGYHEEYLDTGKEDIERAFRKEPIEEISITHDDIYGFIASAYSPIYNSEGEPVALVGADLSMEGIRHTLRKFIYAIIFSVVLVISLSMAGFFVAIRKELLIPLGKLSKATKEMVKNLENEDEIVIDIHTGDELEVLAKSFMKMGGEVRSYIHEISTITAEKERIGAELDVANHIQGSMLPCLFPAFPERKEIDIYATMNPAKEVGGDFYDFFMVDDRHLAIVMADVSGKGIPAALFMVIAKTLIKDHTQLGGELGDVFTNVNNILCESNSESLFVTAFEGVLDLVTGEFRFVNAGHEIPYICKKGGTYEPYKTRAGFVLAGMEGMKYKSGTMQLEPGDKLVQYTDGVTEATNAKHQLYGMDRLTEFLQAHSDTKPMDLLPQLKEDIDLFVGEAPQFDDITMLCLEYKERMVIGNTDEGGNG